MLHRFMNHIGDVAARLLTIDLNTMVCLFIMCMVAAFILREVLDNPPLVWITSPLLVVGSVIFNVIFDDIGVVPFKERGANIALATGVGMIVVLILVIIAARILTEVKDKLDKRRFKLIDATTQTIRADGVKVQA